jgi:hypothetical protein
MRASACIVVLASGAALCACGGVDGWCVDRGTQSAFQGTLQYGGQIGGTGDAGGAGQALAGGAPIELTLDDFTAQDDNNTRGPGSCGATFTVRLSQACVLWGSPQDVRYDTGKNASGDFISADIAIRAAQPCTLALAEGTVVVSVRSGSLQITPGHAQLTFDGDVQSLAGATRSGYLDVMYSSE